MNGSIDPMLYLQDYELQCKADLIKPFESDTEHRCALILRAVGYTRGKMVVDLGSGKGRTVASLQGIRVAVDFSKPYLTHRQFYGKGEHRVRADIECLPMRDGVADVVICESVLEHVLHPHIVLAEAERLLKPEGQLIIMVPYREDISVYRKLPYKYTHLRTFDDETLAVLLGNFAIRRKLGVDASQVPQVAYYGINKLKCHAPRRMRTFRIALMLILDRILCVFTPFLFQLVIAGKARDS